MRFVVALLALALLCGCQMVGPPELIQVKGLSATSLAVGDRLEIVGEGFPEGKNARVIFSGTLFRPGQLPMEGIEIAAEGRSRSHEVVSIAFDADITARFCGKNGYAEHTTFRGDVRVSFASRSASAPPVVGTLLDASLDVTPPTLHPDVLESRRAESRPFVDLLGVELEPVREPNGLAIRRLENGKAADLAGLRPDDVLQSLDGVALLVESDLRPVPGAEEARLAVRRGATRTASEVVIDVSSLHPRSGRQWVPAFALLAIAIAWFVYFAGPLARVVGWIAHLAEERAHQLALRGARPRSWGAALVALLLRRNLGESRSTAVLAYGVFLLVGAGFTFVALGGSLHSDDVDLGLLAVLAVVSFTVGRLVAGGSHGRGSWSLLAGVLAALRGLPLCFLALTAVGATVTASESLSLRQIVEQQGGAPWRWLAFQNPGLFALSVLLLFSAAPHGAKGDWDEIETPGLSQPRSPGAMVLLAEWTALWTVAGLAACLFFGGWRVPLMPHGVMAPSVEGALGAVVLHAKLWLSALSIIGLRAIISGVPPEPLLGLVIRWCVPAAVGSAVVSVLWAEGLDRYDLPRAALGVALCVFSTLVAAHLAVRVHRAAAGPVAHGGINPWL